MTALDAHLREIALTLGQKLQRESAVAQRQLPHADQRLDQTKSRLAGALFLAKRTPRQSPIHAIARRIARDAAISTAEVGDRDIAKDFAAAALMRAQNYQAKDDQGAYNCPACWVKEHLCIGLHALDKTGNDETFQCPSCTWKLTFAHQADTKHRAPIAASRDNSLSG